MIADIGGVMTRTAKSLDDWHIQIIVKTRDVCDVDFCGVEDFFAARNRVPSFRVAIRSAPQGKPRLVEVKKYSGRRACR